MRLTWLGWAGVELEAGGATVVVDPLEDAGAVFAWQAADTPLPRAQVQHVYLRGAVALRKDIAQ